MATIDKKCNTLKRGATVGNMWQQLATPGYMLQQLATVLRPWQYVNSQQQVATVANKWQQLALSLIHI